MPSDNFDIKLTVSGQYSGNALPLRLMSQDGRKMWVVNEYPTQANNPSVPVFSQTDWSGGFGDGNQKTLNKYRDGSAIDTSKTGEFFLGPLIQTAKASGSNDELTTGDDTNIELYGVYWKGQTFTTSAAYSVTMIRLKAFRYGLPGTVTVSIRATSGSLPTGSDLTSGTFDGNSLTTSTSGEWTTIAVTSYSLSNATEYAIVVRATTGDDDNSVALLKDTGNGYASGQCVQSDDSGSTWNNTGISGHDLMFIVAGTSNFAAAITKVIYFSSSVVCATNLLIYQYDTTNDYWTLKKTYTGDAITDLCVFGSNLFIARGASTAYEYTSDLSSFTTSTLTDKYATYFIAAPSPTSTTYNMWKAVTNEVKSISDPTNSTVQWSSAIYVGDTSENITGLMLHNDMLFAGKADGLYYVETSGLVHPELPELQLAKSSNNFKYHVNWQGGLYFSLDTRIGEISSYVFYDFVDPYQNLEDINKKGNCVGLSADRNYLYAFMYDGTDYICYKGFKRENGVWSWCPWINASTNACSTAFVTQLSGENPRLWFNYSTTQSAYVILSDHPLSDSSYKFASSGYLETGWIDLGERDWKKILQAILLEVVTSSTRSLSSTLKATCSYDADEAGSWTAIDTAYTADAQSLTKKYINANNISANKVKFKIQLDTPSWSTTPIINYLAVYAETRPTKIQVFDFWIDIEPTNTKSKTIKDFLDAGRDSTVLVTLNDIFNTNHFCVFEPGYPKHEYVTVEPGRQPRLGAHCVLRKVDWSE